MNVKLMCIILSVALAGATVTSAALSETVPAASEPVLSDYAVEPSPVIDVVAETTDANTVTNLNTGEVFATITAALADTNTLSGHTLSVSAGTFPERPIVSKGVILVGAGSDLTIVNGFAVQNTAGVSISGFRISPATFSSSGLTFMTSPGMEIHDNVIENVKYGIMSYKSPGSIVRNTVMCQGTYNTNQYEAAVNVRDLTALDTLIFCDNVITSQQIGVYIRTPGSGSLIDGNVVTITPLPGYYQMGMAVYASDSTVTNNRVDISTYSALYVGGSSNVIHDNEAPQFGVGGTGQQVFDNTVVSMGLSGSGHTVTRQNSVSSISLNYLTDTTITDNDLVYMYMGPYFSGLTISDNVFYSPSARSYAINFYTWDTNPVNCVIERNTVVSGYSTGFYIGGGRETVRNLVIRDNVIHASTGICLDDCSDSFVQWNRFETCSEALYIRDASCNNEVSNNTFLNNYFAMSLIQNSINNKIFHNNIISTYNQQISTCYPNTWYHDGLLEGNYWSAYTGTDSGGVTYTWDTTGKHLIASDGIGDTALPYWGLDRYPFTTQDGWLPDLAIDTSDITVVVAANSLIAVTVHNIGGTTAYDVTVRIQWTGTNPANNGEATVAVTTGNVAAGSEEIASIYVKLASDTFVVTATVDPDDAIPEMSEDNNQATSAPFTTSVTQPIIDYIAGLDDDAFDKNPDQRRHALLNKMAEVEAKIEAGEYQEAINKLLNDVRAKADGYVDGKLANDWIVDEHVQVELCALIDYAVEYLRTLLDGEEAASMEPDGAEARAIKMDSLAHLRAQIQ